MNRFTDGEWHRLHPATPLLRGGIALVAIIWIIITNLRDLFINQFFGGPENEDDPFAWILDHGLFWVALLVVLGALALFVVGFYVSWRMHSFRITDEVVEVRSGILFRTNRKGRLDRIQGINITRPFFARIFGAAKLEVDVAGHDAKVQLSYLGSTAADELRAEILRLASGTHQASTAPTTVVAGSVIEQRVSELLAPELNPELAAPESVVQLHPGRVVGSIVFSDFTVFLIIAVVGLSVTGVLTDSAFLFLTFIPAFIGLISYYWRKFSRSLRYSIASTPDGLRIGYGLLSTSNDTLPPGRVHAVRVSQPLIWRIFGWWEITVNRASRSSSSGSGGQEHTTVLPVGNKAETIKVLRLLLPDFDEPDLLEAGLQSKGEGYANSPRRAQVLRWISWRRNGYAFAHGAVLLRTGAIWRQLTIVPLVRMQSAALETGPLRKRLRLATVRLHTVAGPISPRIGAVDMVEAKALFARIADEAVAGSATDTSHRWRSHESA